MLQQIPACCGPIVVLAGKGNNGGDALVVARYARRCGHTVEVILMHDPASLSTDAQVMYRRACSAGVPCFVMPENAAGLPAEAADRLDWAQVVVDGLMGTGAKGHPRQPYAQAINAVNQWRAAGPGNKLTVALDIPSGLDSDTGRPYDPTIRADLTVTFHLPKLGLLMGPARDYAGTVWVADIGIPAEAMPAIKARLLLPEQVRAELPGPAADTHKGRRGRLWIVAGSRGMVGAAILVARSALRAGAGLVHVAVPAGERPILAGAVPEALTLPLPETGDGAISTVAIPRLVEALQGADAVVIGPGLGQSESVRTVVEEVIASVRVPVVVDADALNAVAGTWSNVLPKCKGVPVLTPHPGEAARLLACGVTEIQSDRPAAARMLSQQSRGIAVLKGARTLIAEPQGDLWVNPTGSEALATGGTGDVLAGAIGALCAQGISPGSAARVAVFVHGWAGQELAGEFGVTGVIAGDLPAAMARVFHKLRQWPDGERDKILQACGLLNLP